MVGVHVKCYLTNTIFKARSVMAMGGKVDISLDVMHARIKNRSLVPFKHFVIKSENDTREFPSTLPNRIKRNTTNVLTVMAKDYNTGKVTTAKTCAELGRLIIASSHSIRTRLKDKGMKLLNNYLIRDYQEDYVWPEATDVIGLNGDGVTGRKEVIVFNYKTGEELRYLSRGKAYLASASLGVPHCVIRQCLKNGDNLPVRGLAVKHATNPLPFYKYPPEVCKILPLINDITKVKVSKQHKVTGYKYPSMFISEYVAMNAHFNSDKYLLTILKLK